MVWVDDWHSLFLSIPNPQLPVCLNLATIGLLQIYHKKIEMKQKYYPVFARWRRYHGLTMTERFIVGKLTLLLLPPRLLRLCAASRSVATVRISGSSSSSSSRVSPYRTAHAPQMKLFKVGRAQTAVTLVPQCSRLASGRRSAPQCRRLAHGQAGGRVGSACGVRAAGGRRASACGLRRAASHCSQRRVTQVAGAGGCLCMCVSVCVFVCVLGVCYRCTMSSYRLLNFSRRRRRHRMACTNLVVVVG